MKGPFDIALYNREKNRTIGHTNPIISAEKCEELYFFKIQDFDIKMRVELPLKTLVFCLTFFRMSLKHFLPAQ